MDKTKRKRLQAAGWKIGSSAEFLDLSEEEAALIEMKLALADGIRARRVVANLTQTELARRLGSSQSRVAKLEAADGSVSIDLMMRTLLVLGATRHEIGRMIRGRTNRPAA